MLNILIHHKDSWDRYIYLFVENLTYKSVGILKPLYPFSWNT